MKQPCGESHKFHMTTRVRFCLSYDPLKWDFNPSKLNIISIRKRINDDVTSMRQSVITYGHTIFMT